MSCAVLLVDHGSRRAEANRLLEDVAAALRARRPAWIVQVAHMELAAPDVAAGLDACAKAGAREVVVHPYFLGPGNHTARDIPRLVREAAARHPDLVVRISEPLGLHPGIVDAVVARVDAARDEARSAL